MFAQEDFLKEANKLFKNKEFKEALYFYKYSDISENAEALYNRGYCYLELNDLNNAERDFSRSNALGHKDKEVFLLMGKIRHSQNEFDKAALFYKDYLRATKAESKNRDEVVLLLKNCITGLNTKYNEPLGYVENLGEGLNSPYDELNPVRSPNYSDIFYFSSNRQLRVSNEETETVSYDHNIYRIQSTTQGFKEVEFANESLNSFQNEILLDLSSDGSVLFFGKGREEFEVFSDTFTVGSQKLPINGKLNAPINYQAVNALDSYQDSIFLYSANTDGGYGGHDIYAAIRLNGIWLSPMNLGPEINGPYDEISPFLSIGGESLFYSSNRPQSTGGFDVFYSDYDAENSTWSKGKNLGLPINSEGDDINFRLSKDAKTGLLASNRLKDNFGGFDIYYAFLKEKIGSLVEARKLPGFIESFVKRVEEQSYASFEELNAVPLDEVRFEEGIRVDTTIYDKNRETNLQNEAFIFSDTGDLLSGENKEKLYSVVRVLSQNPALKIELIGHTIQEGLKEFDLYFSVKSAEKIADYLMSLDVPKDRILLKGLGSAYPLVKYESGGQKIALADRMNRRVDLNYLTHGNSSYILNEPELNVPQYLLDNKFKLHKTQTEGLTYKVQIAESNKLLKNDALAVYDHLMIEKLAGGSKYIYTLGVYETYVETFFIKKELEKYNIKDPKIVPFLNGNRIDVSLLNILSEQYTDLKYYIEYELE